MICGTNIIRRVGDACSSLSDLKADRRRLYTSQEVTTVLK
jgi:hypothetical protein